MTAVAHYARVVIVAAMAGLLAAACGRAGSPTSAPVGAGDAGPEGRMEGSLTVFAAASLTAPFTAARARMVAENPGFSLTYSFAGSRRLVAQVSEGAPADVVATADHETMAMLVAGRLVETPVEFARNSLQIAVAPRNPRAITRLGDLARPGLKVVLADPSVPAGRYARTALERAGVTVRPVSLELDVKSALGKVTSGEADAAVVYVTDVAAAGTAVAGVDIPAIHNVEASYAVAVVRSTGNRAAALAFVDRLIHGRGREALIAHGFLGV